MHRLLEAVAGVGCVAPWKRESSEKGAPYVHLADSSPTQPCATPSQSCPCCALELGALPCAHPSFTPLHSCPLPSCLLCLVASAMRGFCAHSHQVHTPALYGTSVHERAFIHITGAVFRESRALHSNVDFSSQGGATAAPAAACHCEAVGSARVSSPPLRCAPLCPSLPSPPTPTHPHPTHLHPTSACPVSAVLNTIMPTSRTLFDVQ